jgi:hypothetical protein
MSKCNTQLHIYIFTIRLPVFCLFLFVGGPVMMRYPPPEMMASMGQNGMIMHQRPMAMDPQLMHYPAVGREAGLNEGT